MPPMKAPGCGHRRDSDRPTAASATPPARFLSEWSLELIDGRNDFGEQRLVLQLVEVTRFRIAAGGLQR